LALLYSRRFTKPLQELLRLSFSTSTSRLEPISTDIKEFGQVSDEIIHHLQSVHDHEQQRDVLVNELNHRVRNTLAVIQSVALQTLKSAPSAQEAAEVFQARLIALSAAHDPHARGLGGC